MPCRHPPLTDFRSRFYLSSKSLDNKDKVVQPVNTRKFQLEHSLGPVYSELRETVLELNREAIYKLCYVENKLRKPSVFITRQSGADFYLYYV